MRFTKIAPAILAFGMAAACAPDPIPAPWIPAGTCFQESAGSTSLPDFKYLGPDNTSGNTLEFLSTDGSCSGVGSAIDQKFVRAADATNAGLICLDIQDNATGLAFPMAGLGVTFAPELPSDAWLCGIN